jgi:hypothetical protein
LKILDKFIGFGNSVLKTNVCLTYVLSRFYLTIKYLKRN